MIRAGAFLGVAVVVDRTLGARVLAAAEAGAGASLRRPNLPVGHDLILFLHVLALGQNHTLCQGMPPFIHCLLCLSDVWLKFYFSFGIYYGVLHVMLSFFFLIARVVNGLIVM